MGEALPELRDIMHKIKETYDVHKENVGVGSTIFAVKPVVVAAIQKLKDEGLYPQKLWEEE